MNTAAPYYNTLAAGDGVHRGRRPSTYTWESERAWMVYDWLKAEGTITRAELCKRFGIKDRSLQGIMGELHAHHYVIQWRDGRDTYYQLQADAIEAHRYRTRGDGLT